MVAQPDKIIRGGTRGFYRRLTGELVEHARREAELDTRQPDGATLRTHLQRAAAQGKTDPLLDFVDPPKLGAPLWGVFMELNRSRPSGMGPGAIPPTEIEAWCRMNNIRLTPWEFSTIVAMDSAVLSLWSDQRADTK